MLLAVQVIGSLCSQQYNYRALTTGVLVRGGLITAIYERSLKLSSHARSTLTNGKLVNHISTDVSRIDFCAGFFHAVPYTFLLWLFLSNLFFYLVLDCSDSTGYMPCIANPYDWGVCTCGFCNLLHHHSCFGYNHQICICCPPSDYAMDGQTREASARGSRRHENRQIFCLGASNPRANYKTSKPRDPVSSRSMAEDWRLTCDNSSRGIRKLLLLKAGNISLVIIMPTIATIVGLVTYSLTGHPLDPASVFTALTFFNLLRMPLMFLRVFCLALHTSPFIR